MSVERSRAASVIDGFETAPQYTLIPHPVGAGLEAVFQTSQLREDATIYALVYEDGEVIHTAWETDDCDGCSNNEDFTPSMGTPPEAAQAQRRRANCEHATLASRAFHLRASVGGPCPDCESWAVAKRVLSDGHAEVAMHTCGQCGTRRV